MDLKVPIVLVGNKIDTRGGVADPEAAAKMERFIKPIMDRFREVDVCIECSAKTVSNISEVFYFAQKAVLYPTGPVYDVETHSLRPRAKAALRRIFKICDKDMDGGLNDTELNDFQHTCFNVRLQPAEIDGVKRVVRENRPTDGLRPDGSLSVAGFIFLHTLFVQKGRLETTWIVLRKFGYDDEMRLRIDESDLPRNVGVDQCVELSSECTDFLKHIFEAADRDKDGLLAPDDLSKVFAECSDGPFAEDKLRNGGLRLVESINVQGRGDYINFKGFLARWSMLTLESVEDALRCLVHLGYEGRVGDAVVVSQPRRRDRYSRTVSRGVVQVGIFGAEGALKADIVRGMVGQPRWQDTPGVASASQRSDGETEKTLVLRSISTEEERELLTMRVVSSSGANTSGNVNGGFSYLTSLQQLDVVCIVFDVNSQESFAHGLEIWQALQERSNEIKMPVVFVGSFGEDATDVDNVVALNMADEFCLEQRLPTPTRVSISQGEYGRLYDDLLGVALFPQVACPDYYDNVGDASTANTVIKVSGSVVLLGITVYAAKKLYDYYTTKPASGAGSS